jgi:hypothetical protein
MADKTKKKEKKKTKNEMDFPPIKVVIDGMGSLDVRGGNKKFRNNLRQKKLDQDLDKQGYKPTLETQAGTKVSAFDNTNKIRAGLKKGGRAGYKYGKSVKKKGGCAIKGKSPILR